MTTGKPIALTRWNFVGKVMTLLFNMLSRLVIAFLQRSKRLLISWLQLPPAVILEPKKIKSLTISIASPFICHEVMRLDAMILVFWMLSFNPAFSHSSFTFIKRLLAFCHIPDPGIEPGSLALQVDSLLTELWGNCYLQYCVHFCCTMKWMGWMPWS